MGHSVETADREYVQRHHDAQEIEMVGLEGETRLAFEALEILEENQAAAAVAVESFHQRVEVRFLSRRSCSNIESTK